MRRWRLFVAGLWLLLLGSPLAAVAGELVRSPSVWNAWPELDRLLPLARNTVMLVGGTLALTLPLGIALALLLYRSDLPGRGIFRRLIVLALFIPLPLLASAWQSALGSGGWLPLPAWETVAAEDPDYSPTGISWKPWAQGLPAAIWVHAMAGLPWLIWLSGQGLAYVERTLEEDALLHGGVRAALMHVTLPRAAPAIAAGALWVALQAASEITVTDMMQVRTFAEEVYTQFGTTERDVWGRALAVATPPALLCGILAAVAYSRWGRRLPPLADVPERFCIIRLRRVRWLAAALMIGIACLVFGVPLAGLLWKSGQVPPGETWSVLRSAGALSWAVRTEGSLVAGSLFWSALTGAAVALLGLVSCWLARDVRWPRGGMLVLLTLAYTLPGPVLGIGLKETIKHLVNLEEFVSGGHAHMLATALYNGPSPLPVMWASTLRFLPCAIAVLWPAVRALPRELSETARTDGATPAWELRHAVAAPLLPVLGRVAVAVTALSLGELSAGKLVATPGGQTFAHEVFMQMHNGVGNHLAAMCLLLLAAVALPLALGGLAGIWRHSPGAAPPEA